MDTSLSGQPCLELNKVICEHLFRQGKMEVGEALMKVSEMMMDVLTVSPPPPLTGGRAGARPLLP